jgi:hypothetical protein
MSASGVWIPDSEALNCMICDERFSIHTRRHHCRICGKCICGSCSNNRLKLVQLKMQKKSRVCDQCFKAHAPAWMWQNTEKFASLPSDDNGKQRSRSRRRESKSPERKPLLDRDQSVDDFSPTAKDGEEEQVRKSVCDFCKCC